MTRFALFQGDKRISPPFITRESLSFFIKEHRKFTLLRPECHIKEIADNAESMQLVFDDNENQLEISENSEHPLEITIMGSTEQHTQSYCMNENEIVALFNLLYETLKRDYSKKLEEMQ